MSALTVTVGYPPHAVARYTTTVTEHQVTLTDWTAACGATGREVGDNPFGRARSAGRRELCPKCFPAGHQTYHPDPINETPATPARPVAPKVPASKPARSKATIDNWRKTHVPVGEEAGAAMDPQTVAKAVRAHPLYPHTTTNVLGLGGLHLNALHRAVEAGAVTETYNEWRHTYTYTIPESEGQS